jgi:aryl-alcohol dehydrogenase-like predicted oxidoreductase
MRYRSLGNSGLRVSELCLGAMTFGAAASRSDGEAILERFVAAGGNFVDTAVNYAAGASEEILGGLIAGDRDRFVVATKYTAPLRDGDPNSAGNQRKSLRQALDTSLGRLDTDYVDLYWVHAWDGRTPIEETMRALDDAVRAGKVLHVGISNAPAWLVTRANTIAEHRGWTPFSAIQVEYNLTERTPERDLLPMAAALGLEVLAWGPLAGGLLSGKYNDPSEHDAGRLQPGDRRLTERNLAIASELRVIAADIGTTPGQCALAWIRSRSAPSVLPILGARTPDQLDEALGCLEITLDDSQLHALDEASAISLGYPHEFLASLRDRPGRGARGR